MKHTSGQLVHTCGICNKAFERRDLRERHRRRCERSSQNPRTSKRRSCLACVGSKQKCDLASPSCSRCADHDITCEYPRRTISNPSTTSKAPTQIDVINDNMSWAEPTWLDERSEIDTQDATSYRLTYKASSGLETLVVPDITPAVSEELEGFQYQSQNESRHEATSPRNLFDAPYMEKPFGLLPDYWDPSIAGMDTVDLGYHGNQEMSAPHYFERENGFSLLNMLGIPGNEASTSRKTRSQQRFQYNGQGGRSSVILDHIGNTSSNVQNSPSGASSFILENTSLNGGPHLSLSANLERDHGPTEIASLTTDSFDEDAGMIVVVNSYLRSLLQKDDRCPFIHHIFYTIAQGDTPEPLANAICCVSAYEYASQNSAPLVYDMVDDQAEKLLSNYHKSSSSYVDTLAAVHAMCAYQIIGLMGKFRNLDLSRIKKAEMRQSFFIKMTRNISQLLPTLQSRYQNQKCRKDWALAETLRRTIFMVNVINELSQRVKELNPSFFEPLDDNLVFDLQMPARESLWTASEHEWKLANEGGEVGASTTLKEFLKESGHAYENDLIPEFTRIIISCTKKRLGG